MKKFSPGKYNIKFLTASAAALALCIALLTACGNTGESASVSSGAEEKSSTYVDAMDTYMILTAYGPNREKGLQASGDEIVRLDNLLSTGIETSEIARANTGETLTVSEDTGNLLQSALDYYTLTGGLFDITITPVEDLWGFYSKNYHVPTDDELAAALALTGVDHVHYDSSDRTLTLTDSCRIDLGGIAKGFTSQRVMEVLADNGVTSAIVSLGCNVQCLGTKPDGSDWQVGIRLPGGAETDLAGVLSVTDCAIISSALYERNFTDEKTGITYGHIIDPRTGRPVENDLAQVTIVSPNGTLADALSTSLFIMGLNDAEDFWRLHSGDFEVVFITNDNKIIASPGLKDCLTPYLNCSYIEDKAEDDPVSASIPDEETEWEYLETPDSTCFDKVGYNSSTCQLFASFRSGYDYIYSDVPANVYSELISADSAGSYFNANINGKYDYNRVS